MFTLIEVKAAQFNGQCVIDFQLKQSNKVIIIKETEFE